MTQLTQQTPAGHEQQPVKPIALLPYAKPELKVYGAVRDLTLGTGSVNGDSGALSMATGPSDRALKEDVRRVGTHPLGFGLYLFKYKPEFRDFCPAGEQFGVMADEVQPVCPEAIGEAHGYKTVDYSRLGIARFLQ